MNRNGKVYGLRDSQMTVLILNTHGLPSASRYECLILSVDQNVSYQDMIGLTTSIYVNDQSNWDENYEEL